MGSRRRPPPGRRSRPRPRLTSRDFDGATGARATYVAELDNFQGDVTLAKARRALVMRQGFLRALLGDPRVQGWLESRIRAGLDRRSVNLDGVLELVRDNLGLKWPWCAERILKAFTGMVRGAKVITERPDGGGVVEIPNPQDVPELDTEEADVLAPPMVSVFTTVEGESIAEAIARWAAHSANVIAELSNAAASATPAGERTSRQLERLRLWGRWYYEARVAKPRKSINAIAKSHQVDRKTVRDGIADAERTLSLGAGVLNPLGD